MSALAPGSYEGLTRRQASLLSFIRSYCAEHGYSPSMEEMAAALGLKAKSGAHRIVQGLSERGYISRMPLHPRSIWPNAERVTPTIGLRGVATAEMVAELKSRGFGFTGAWA